MPPIKGHMRRSQLITTYGVGSIIPVGDEAFMIAGLERWQFDRPDLHEPRLQRELRVFGFVQPPASEDRPDIPVVRFPTWQSCPVCRRLAPLRRFTHWDLNSCPDCSQELVPSRFVIACERGHIDDFPYERWVHRGPPAGGVEHNLTLTSSGHTASLSGIVISCSCGAERTMEDAFNRFALKDVTSCQGRRPWLMFEGESCDEMPRALQRGASSVWFGLQRSALSIPPWSEAASRALDGHWPTLRHLPPEALPAIIASMKLTEKTGFSETELVEIFKARKQEDAGEAVGESGLRTDEFKALLRGREETPSDREFATEPGRVPDTLNRYLSQLQMVTRLREVRALAGFSRIFPPRALAPGTGNVIPIVTDANWLPAIEVKGEGLFMTLQSERLEEWAARPAVRARVETIAAHDRARHEQWGVPQRREITPAFLLLHVLAHAFINELALDAGYPTGSLRERLYYEDGACGLLVYTATSDSAGSLGGLVSHGEPARFEPLLTQAIRRASWCSADPVCIETVAAGAESLNLAACHSCVLLPETSCEELNSFLDRALLTGLPDDPSIGYFEGL